MYCPSHRLNQLMDTTPGKMGIYSRSPPPHLCSIGQVNYKVEWDTFTSWRNQPAPPDEWMVLRWGWDRE